ncbi:response regulator transcription factor [Burkholderia sp. Ac-20345]|uniref:response regulator transcription factor n=1 Tax=Burkholderia sp. Ac-20345 TaxID=2703891 RepID=UPI00197BF2A4|nr:response regulator transcription factor [Burkholderia sp. Ac-20345]MBN3784802.1 response regulator transcription factor [Burkholderia sp. Ac-20345]
MKILVLDDDVVYLEYINLVLRGAGHEVLIAEDGTRAIRILEKASVDLVILDWIVPMVSGLDVLRWIRHNLGPFVPIIFITNRQFDQHIAEALNSGADDYVVKPVGRNELIARVAALTRRGMRLREFPDVVRVGDYIVDKKARSVSLRGNKFAITRKEFDIAVEFFDNVGTIISRDHLVNIIWGKPESVMSRSLDTHVYRLRNKLSLSSENGLLLKSVYMIGYRLELV